MHGYDQAHGSLPPAVVYGPNGRPLLSWRVLLLPYLEQNELFKEFKLDEPWDSPHNLPLLSRMPNVYAPPPGKAWKLPPHHTVMQVFVGKRTAFEGPRGLSLKTDFPDQLSNTILVVEGGPAVPWTKPDDLSYYPHQPLPELATLFSGEFRVCMADCIVRWVKTDVPEGTLRAAITRNGGEFLADDW
jgi:hypothetical protein